MVSALAIGRTRLHFSKNKKDKIESNRIIVERLPGDLKRVISLRLLIDKKSV